VEPTPAAEPFAGVGEERLEGVQQHAATESVARGRRQGWRPGVHAIRTLGGHACGVEIHTDISVPRIVLFVEESRAVSPSHLQHTAHPWLGASIYRAEFRKLTLHPRVAKAWGSERQR
jgi:hypothetical protein